MFHILIPKDKREIKTLLLKVSAGLAISVGGYLVYRRRIRPSLPPPPPSSVTGSHFVTKKSSDHQYSTKAMRMERSVAPKVPKDDDFPNSEENDYSHVKNVDSTKMEQDMPKAYGSFEREDYEEEVKRLRNMVRNLRDRETNLELQLLEYYGLKEQETTMMELQNRLKINNMEAKLFNIKVETLQAENRRLEAQVAEYVKVSGELEMAKAKVKILRRKLRYESEQNKEQILALQKRVQGLQDQEKNAISLDSNIDIKLKRLSELEKEAEELRKSNNKLKIENSDLVRRLESTQILATSVLEDQETEELKQVSVELKRKNEELAKEIEQLQADRCTDVEELVYLRWINACLRHELRNFQAQPGKTVAKDLSKTLSPKSEAKAKQLILEYANSEGIVNKKGIDIDSEWSSSQTFMTAECETETEPDDHRPKKAKFLSKLRKLITGKDRHPHNHHNDLSSPGKSTPMGRTHGTSDSDSPGSSLRTECNLSDRSLKYASSPFRTSSLDLQSRSSLNIDDQKEISRMSSDAGSSSHSYRRFSGFRESLSDLSEQDSEFSHKAELVKYAEALKGSNSKSTTPR